jgi:hypothetical protein
LGAGTGNGSVTSVVAGSYLTGGTITTTGTLAVDADTANTAGKVVARDGSGNFSAGTVTANLTGTASGNLSLSGGTLTGGLTGTTADFQTPNSGTTGGLRVRGNATSGLAYIQFTDSTASSQWGYASVNSSGSLTWSGAITATGNITAYSDERLKKDWAAMPSDFVEHLANVKSGTYTRIDSGERQAGSSAQDWQALLPEVVMAGADEEKTLSLAYGNAALVSAVELAKRVVAQDERIAKLEALVAQLAKGDAS